MLLTDTPVTTITPHAFDETPAPASRDAAFRSLVEANQRAVYYLALDLTGQHHDAEDLSQEVFIKAYKALDAFRGEASAYSWLYRITVNTYLNRRRKKALRFRQLWDDFSLMGTRDSAPGQEVEADIRRQHVNAALRKLSPRERTAFVLRHYQDLSVKEVAGLMDVAEGTVKSLLFRAVQKLRDALSFYREELGLPNPEKKGTNR